MVKFDYHLMHLCNSSVFEIMRGQKETNISTRFVILMTQHWKFPLKQWWT